MPHMLDLDTPIRIHLIGAGGVGMSALAKLLWSKGHEVSGSDMRMASIMNNLADLGLEVWEGSRPEAMAGCDLVVASSAVPESDWEVKAAKDANITVWERPELLTAITDQIPTIRPLSLAANLVIFEQTHTLAMTICSCLRPMKRFRHSSVYTSGD
jgi:UDP-N-acetylmuramate-alanine ligase